MDPKEMKRKILRPGLCGSNSDQWLFIIKTLTNIMVLWEVGSIIASWANECIAVGALCHGVRKCSAFQILSTHGNHVTRRQFKPQYN